MPWEAGAVGQFSAAHNMTVTQFAEACEVDLSHLNRVFNGRRESKRIISTIARVVGKHPATVSRHIRALRNKTNPWKRGAR